MFVRMRRYLIAGILFWIPLWATWVMLNFVIQLLDKSVALLPKEYQPEQLLGYSIPGFGIILSILLLLLTGLFVSNFFGRRLIALWELILNRIPLVRSVYSAVKQVLHSVLSPEGNAFRKVLLIEYPRKGIWSLAFQTGADAGITSDRHPNEPLITAFVPTTPNPTSGFLLLLPKSDVQELNISIDEALKLVISLGVVQPKMTVPKASEQLPRSS